MKRIDISRYVLTDGHTTLAKGIYNACDTAYKRKSPIELVFDYNNDDYVLVSGAIRDRGDDDAYVFSFVDWYNGEHKVLIVRKNDGVHIEKVG